MEVVLVLIAIVGIALVAVGRLRKQRTVARPVRASAPATRSWRPPAGDSGWNDDLDPEPLPSIERWRERAAAGEAWDVDDGLGWEGEDASEHAPSEDWTGPAARAPEPTGRFTPAAREQAPTDRPAPEASFTPAAGQAKPAFIADALADRTATLPTEALAPRPATTGDERTEAASTHDLFPGDSATGDDDLSTGRAWVPEGPPRTPWEDGPKAAPAAPRRSRRNRIHPVLLVALYAAAGIGLVVLASTVLLGGSTPAPKPAKPRTVRAITAQPTATPQVLGRTAGEAGATVNAAARKASEAQKQHLQDQLRNTRRQLAKARAAAHRKAAHKTRHKSAAARPAATATATHVAPAAPTPTYRAPAAPTHSSGSSHSGGGGGKSCEFCIG